MTHRRWATRVNSRIERKPVDPTALALVVLALFMMFLIVLVIVLGLRR